MLPPRLAVDGGLTKVQGTSGGREMPVEGTDTELRSSRSVTDTDSSAGLKDQTQPDVKSLKAARPVRGRYRKLQTLKTLTAVRSCVPRWARRSRRLHSSGPVRCRNTGARCATALWETETETSRKQRHVLVLGSASAQT